VQPESFNLFRQQECLRTVSQRSLSLVSCFSQPARMFAYSISKICIFCFMFQSLHAHDNARDSSRDDHVLARAAFIAC
jgi:hypothetical protein